MSALYKDPVRTAL